MRTNPRVRVAFGVMLIAGLGLLALTLVARSAAPDAVDVRLARALQSLSSPTLDAFMYAVSWPGFSPQGILMPLAAAAVAYAWLRQATEALWLGCAPIVAGVLNAGFKLLIQRPRPSPDLVDVVARLSDYSFPSGHVVEYTSLFGFAMMLVLVFVHRSALRTAALILLALPIGVVGVSRVYLGQHWPSDVLGGYALATLVLMTYSRAYFAWIARGRPA